MIGDDTARRLEELIFETRSQIEALDRRLREIEAARADDATASPAQVERSKDRLACATDGGALPVPNPTPPTLPELRIAESAKLPFDRKRYHAGYMRTWRARRKALLGGDNIP